VEIGDFKMLIPSKQIPKWFDEKLSGIFQMVETKISQNKKLSELQNLLLSKLATIEN